MTPQEAKLWVALRKLRPAGQHFRRQVAIGHCVVDFACLKSRLIVEVDGGQHGADGHAQRDAERDAVLAQHEFLVLRFWNADVDRDLRSVMDTIVARLDGRGPTPVRGDAATRPSPPGRENPRSDTGLSHS